MPRTREERKLLEACAILEYALALRMHGEDPDHGAQPYTWRTFDERCETFLREQQGLIG